MTSAANSNLATAKKARQDEFYTQLADIERELKHYRKHFMGKIVYLNCDDPRESQFFHYFSYNFEKLGLKKLIAAGYKSQDVDLFSTNSSERAIYLEYTGDTDGSRIPDPSEIEVKHFDGNGDFRSEESLALLKQADIVVTNPPFSLFREYVAQLIEYDKKFVIVGPKGAVTYRDIFPFFERNQMWIGYGFQAGNAYFRTSHPTDYAKGVFNEETGLVKFRNVTWLTNLDIAKRHEELTLFKPYNPATYPKYDNFDAIHVSAVVDIPADYEGVMGVPITYLDIHNPSQFEIVGITKTWYGAATRKYPQQIQVSADGRRSKVGKLNDGAVLKVDTPPVGKTYYIVDDGYYMQVYPRILIRRKGASA